MQQGELTILYYKSTQFICVLTGSFEGGLYILLGANFVRFLTYFSNATTSLSKVIWIYMKKQIKRNFRFWHVMCKIWTHQMWEFYIFLVNVTVFTEFTFVTANNRKYWIRFFFCLASDETSSMSASYWSRNPSD